MNNRPVRLGVIGCGNVLSAYSAAIGKLRASHAVEPIIACGREEQRDSACAHLQLSRFTTDEHEVLRDPDVDLVLILTSMGRHADLAIAALQHGKHVLVEKPMATNLDDARKVISVARESGRFLACAPFTALSPTFGIMLGRIQRGEIGQVCSARARYGWSGPWWSEWFYQKGGGCIFDLGVYCITSLTGLLGPVHRVMAMTGVAIPQRQVNGKAIEVVAEDNAQVLLDFGDSKFGVVTCGFTMQQYRSPAIEIYGTDGVIQMLGDDWDPDGYELWLNSVGAWQLYKETTPDWSWTDGLGHVVDCIRTGEKLRFSAEHALHVLEIMLAAQQSGAEGRAVAVKSTFSMLRPEVPASHEPAHLVHDRTRKH